RGGRTARDARAPSGAGRGSREPRSASSRVEWHPPRAPRAEAYPAFGGLGKELWQRRPPWHAPESMRTVILVTALSLPLAAHAQEGGGALDPESSATLS